MTLFIGCRKTSRCYAKSGITNRQVVALSGAWLRIIFLVRLDDWLLVKLTEIEAREVLEIIEARHGSRSTMLCSQYAPGGWHAKLGEGAIADAVIDRLVHSSHTIHIDGKESMRKRTSRL